MQNSGQRNRQGGDVGQRIEVCRACAIAHPQPFLTCGFEAGIVTLTLCTQGIDTLKTQAFPVNGKSVVCWNGLVFRAAPFFLAVIPVFVVTRANTGLRLAERAAVFLPNPPSAIGGLAIFAYGETSFSDRITNGQFFRTLCTALV